MSAQKQNQEKQKEKSQKDLENEKTQICRLEDLLLGAWESPV